MSRSFLVSVTLDRYPRAGTNIGEGVVVGLVGPTVWLRMRSLTRRLLARKPVGDKRDEGQHKAQLAEGIGPRPSGEVGELPAQCLRLGESSGSLVHPSREAVQHQPARKIEL